MSCQINLSFKCKTSCYDANEKNGLFISHDDLESLEILSVDLSQDYFGLDKNHWFSLTERVDEVFHLAAAVNMTSPFDVLYSDNVLATANILRFCLTNKRKNYTIHQHYQYCSPQIKMLVRVMRKTI